MTGFADSVDVINLAAIVHQVADLDPYRDDLHAALKAFAQFLEERETAELVSHLTRELHKIARELATTCDLVNSVERRIGERGPGAVS